MGQMDYHAALQVGLPIGSGGKRTGTLSNHDSKRPVLGGGNPKRKLYSNENAPRKRPVAGLLVIRCKPKLIFPRFKSGLNGNNRAPLK
jgi:hypothetical protein